MQSKGTSIRAAISDWEQKSSEKISIAKEVKLNGLMPPIEKMDSSLTSLSSVEKLSLSTNCIEKISNLTHLKCLKILSLGRNNIKSLAGLEPVSETLQELWISYNQIEKLTGIGCLRNLKVLYMSNNLVKDWSEFQRLMELPCLEDILFVGNPLEERHSLDGSWRLEATRRLPILKKLDGVPVIRENEDEVVLQIFRQESKEKEHSSIHL